MALLLIARVLITRVLIAAVAVAGILRLLRRIIIRRRRRVRRSGRERRRIARVGVGLRRGIAVLGSPIDVARRRSARPRRIDGFSGLSPRGRVPLPDQPREFRKRISAAIGPITIVSHRTCSNFGVSLQFRATIPHDCSCRPPAAWSYRISFGAPTPSNASPDARTVTTPCTRTRRAIVNCRSSWIMKRKCGDALPNVHSA